jgi:hypothetical protein
MIFKRFLIMFVLLYCLQSASALENLALHKSYTFSPVPNYSLCTDKLDTVQLTDGKKSGSLWTSKETVGWRKVEPVVEIVVDLGQIYGIDEVRIFTVGGGFVDVEFPEFIAVLLSNDSKQYKFAGMVSSKSIKNIRSVGNHGVSRTLSVQQINTTGRYVKLAIKPTGLNFFTDEIEIFGEPVPASKSYRNMDSLEAFVGYDKLLDRIDNQLQLEDDIAAARKALDKKNLSSDILYSDQKFIELRNQIGRERANIYQKFYKKPFVCLPANPMDVVYEKEMPLKDNKTHQIDVKLWGNEYESAAFNIINCSENTLKMSVSISPLTGPGHQQIDSKDTFTVRRAIYVRASEAGSIADALVLQQRPFEITPGELQQIWLTIYNPSLGAGNYNCTIAVSADVNGTSMPVEAIPVNLEVKEQRIPEKSALQTCNWAYYDVAEASNMADDLRRHYTNVYVVPAQDLPFLRFSSDKPGVVRKPDYTRLDNILKEYNYTRVFMLGLNFNATQKDFGRFGSVQWMTPQWKETFNAWLKDLVNHLKERGVGYDRFVLYPFDESLCDDYYELAKIIKAADPKIRLYANSFGSGPNEFLRFRDLIDIWCLQDSHCVRYPDWFKTIKSFGKEMWTYECLRPAKAQEPYSYYRLMPWRAFQRGQSGAGFWLYYDGNGFESGAVPWDDTLRPYGYSSVVYGAKESKVNTYGEPIIPSRRWEAWREGVEDYQYLYQVQQTINKLKIKDATKVKTLQKTLDEQVNRVINNPNDSNIVYQAREILTNLLSGISFP